MRNNMGMTRERLKEAGENARRKHPDLIQRMTVASVAARKARKMERILEAAKYEVAQVVQP